jgi:hypothetical protein
LYWDGIPIYLAGYTHFLDLSYDPKTNMIMTIWRNDGMVRAEELLEYDFARREWMSYTDDPNMLVTVKPAAGGATGITDMATSRSVRGIRNPISNHVRLETPPPQRRSVVVLAPDQVKITKKYCKVKKAAK